MNGLDTSPANAVEAGGAPAAARRRGVAVVLALGLWLASAAHAAQPWRIVILGGLDPAQPAAIVVEREFRRTIEAAAPHGVEFYTDAIDNARFEGTDVMPEYLALLAKKYRQREVDLVVARSDFGLMFAERYHQQLWPGKPVLVHGIEEQRLRERGLPASFASLPLRTDVDGTLAIAEALQPQARRLVVVAGIGEFEMYWAQRTAQSARQRTSRQWVPEIWSGVPVGELRDRLAALDPNTAVVYTLMYRDRDGRSYFPLEVVEPIAAVSAAPIYGWYPNYLDRGLTAGSLMSHADHGRRAAELALGILRGETAVAGATLPPTASRCVANVARMEALRLDVGALPAGCELADQPPSLWREHRGLIAAGLIVFALQALTIAALLMHRHRRQLAENDASRRRLELARATRVAALGELTASIAHEVGQPLSAIVTNSQAAELMLQRGAHDALELREIFSDVRRDALRANEVVRRVRALLEKRPVELVAVDLNGTLNEALSLLAPEARSRGITIERAFGAGGTPLVGDRIQLQQVVLNLVLNAMDAMRDTAAERRVLSVSTRFVGSGVELAVADRGRGLPAVEQSRLFESFYTTKPNGVGLGLSIVRTIVGAHGGRVWAAARNGGGSTFTVWLPQAGAATSGRAAPAAIATQEPVAPVAISGER